MNREEENDWDENDDTGIEQDWDDDDD